MDNKESTLKELLFRYQANKISAEEFNQLVNDVNSSSDEQIRDILLSHWNDYEDTDPLPEKKKEEIYQRIVSRIHIPFVIRLRRYWMQIAASLFFILMGAWSLKLYHENVQIKQLVSQDVVFNSGETGHSQILLPDGTTVLLNAKSTLSYQQDFGYKNREVKILGEGLFKVQRDSTKEFIVRTGFMNITVLGTTFNVCAYENQNIVEMSLIEGSVKVSSEKNPTDFIYVKPNEKVTYDKGSGKLNLERCPAKSAIAWSQKELVFQNTRLEDVFSALENKFHVDFRIDSNTLLNDRYTGVFDDKDIDNILGVLQYHYHFTYKKTKNTIYIKK